MHEVNKTRTYITVAVLILLAILSGYLTYTAVTQSNEIDRLLIDRNIFLNEATANKNALIVASSTIEELTGELIDLKANLENLADDYRDEKDRNEEFEDQIRDLAGTLGDLDKLAKTDKELLQKYSKVYFLNENYSPVRIKKIDGDYILAGRDDQYFHASAIDKLEDLLDAAEKNDIDLKVVSGYRSFEEQTSLKGQYTQVYGTGANTFSADQGYSEHQLGTTVDLTTPEIGGAYDSFAQTEAYEWLLKNAYRYGFVLSYPENNSFYVFEPWHWRFVGEDLARDLNRADDHFYDWDQREIDKYLLTIFD